MQIQPLDAGRLFPIFVEPDRTPMLTKPLPAILLLLASWTTVFPAAGQSPYAGEERRVIKSLSAEEVAGFLAGKGMGMARAAELNGYPGPMHVLELAQKLRLTAQQAQETRAIRERMLAKATKLGAELIRLERELDGLFASGKATPEELDRQMAALSAVQGQIRAAHLEAHIHQRAVLSEQQVAAYKKARGYSK